MYLLAVLPVFLLATLNIAFFASRVGTFPDRYLAAFLAFMSLAVLVLTVLTPLKIQAIGRAVADAHAARKTAESLRHIGQLLKLMRRQYHDLHHQLQTVYCLLETGRAPIWAPYFHPVNLFWLLPAGYLACCLTAWRWAPGAAPDADLGPARRLRFKLLSLLYLQVFMAGTVYLVREGHSSLAVAGLAALVARGASLTRRATGSSRGTTGGSSKSEAEGGARPMPARLKKLLITPVALAALFVAAMGIKPASYFTWYQPRPPKGR